MILKPFKFTASFYVFPTITESQHQMSSTRQSLDLKAFD